MLTSRASAQENGRGPSKTEQHRSTRAVLGEIDQNVHAGRVQPFRAAKQNATTEGFFTTFGTGKSACQETLKVFDEFSTSEPGLDVNVKKHLLHPALTALPFARVPLSTLSVTSGQSESPMVLDECAEESAITCDANQDSVFSVSEYADEIFYHLRVAEKRNRPKANYMRKQQDITGNMRAILVDWLVEVAEEYKLHTETTHLAVNYIDRFLSHMAVMRGKLQLVGTAAMFLAAKFEEIYPPDVGEFVYITDDTYTKKQVLRMEHLILKVLSFDIAVPTSNQFLPRFWRAAKADRKTELFSSYICELALNDCDLIGYLPSFIAASAVCLASYTVSGKIWDDSLQHCMQYELEELAPCIQKLYEICKAAPKLPQQAAVEKYKEAKMECVSRLELPQSLPFEEVPE